MSTRCQSTLLAASCMCWGKLLFNYLGMPLFKGKSSSLFMRPIAYRILAQLGVWKGQSLSLVVLVW